MKFLSSVQLPKMTITRTKRKCEIDEKADLITLYETITKIELSIPAFWTGLQEAFFSVLGGLLLPRFVPVRGG